jgi:quinol monooxygenase YgiN
MKPIHYLHKFAGMSIVVISLFTVQESAAQQKNSMVRLARLVIDSTMVVQYKTFLEEEIETSLRVEPGVLILYPVSEKKNPDHITILEIYADSAAYKAHIKTAHFLKYKTGTKDMVRSLELIDATPLIPDMKIKGDIPHKRKK